MSSMSKCTGCGEIYDRDPVDGRCLLCRQKTIRHVNKISIEFFLPMRKVPSVTHQQKQVTIQNGKPVFYEPATVKAARSKLTAHLGQHTPPEPYTGPIRLIVKWCFPITNNRLDGEWKTTKPDVDNAQKLLQDCMTDLGFWKDDSQVVSLVAEKFWARIPGIYIRIEEL